MSRRIINTPNDDNWRKFAAIAKLKGMKAGDLLDVLIFNFLEKYKIKESKTK